MGDGDPRDMRGAWMYDDAGRRLSFTIILFVATLPEYESMTLFM